MKMSIAVAGGMLALSGLFIAGCMKHSNGPVDASSTDLNQIAQIQSQALADPFVSSDEATFSDQSLQPTDYGSLGLVESPVTPLRWARFISGVTRTVIVCPPPKRFIVFRRSSNCVFTFSGVTVIEGSL